MADDTTGLRYFEYGPLALKRTVWYCAAIAHQNLIEIKVANTAMELRLMTKKSYRRRVHHDTMEKLRLFLM